MKEVLPVAIAALLVSTPLSSMAEEFTLDRSVCNGGPALYVYELPRNDQGDVSLQFGPFEDAYKFDPALPQSEMDNLRLAAAAPPQCLDSGSNIHLLLLGENTSVPPQSFEQVVTVLEALERESTDAALRALDIENES